MTEKTEGYKFLFNHKNFPGKINYSRMEQFDKRRENFKLYCLFRFKKEHVTNAPFIRKEILKFGPKTLFIRDFEEFINRVKNRLEELQINFSYDDISYYEEGGINENLTVFDKPDRFKYQHEFRFCIKDSSPKPFSFCIGSIEDISVLIETKKLIELRVKEA